MTEQELIERTPYKEVTNKIKVSVLPVPLEESSDLSRHVYTFSYTVRLENLGEETVQLLERYWRVFSGDSQITEVIGPGVAGGHPVLHPNETYQYRSNAVIDGPLGSMEGTYTFRSEAGKFFQVTIPNFDLVYPEVFH